MIILTILCHLGTFTYQIYRKPWLECLWHLTANGADRLPCSSHAGPKLNPLFPSCRCLTISLQMLPPYFVAFLCLYFISCHILLFHRLKSNYFSMAIWVSVNIFCHNSQWIMVSSPPHIVTYVRCSLCMSPHRKSLLYACVVFFSSFRNPHFPWLTGGFLPCQALSVFLHRFLFSLILLHGCL